MADEGVLSSMSIPLPVQNASIGALNVYARRPHAFDPAAVALGERFAGFAADAVANAVANAVSFATATELAANMQRAMESRAVIEQAKGIVMANVGCDAGKAFELLVQQSQHENRKLRDIASELVANATRSRQ